MKVIDRILFGLIAFCLLLASCTNTNTSGPQSQNPTLQKGDFASFLALFKESESFASWDRDVLDVAGGMEGVYAPEQVQNKTLRANFTEIGPEFLHFIPTSSIVNLGNHSSDDIPDPGSAFKFWATYKFRAKSYWMVSVFALKREWVDTGNHKEFHAHPVLLATYTTDGKPIDHFRWSVLIDDMEQISDADVDVFGDTLVRGYKPSFEAPALTKVYSKTILSEEGKFKMIFKTNKETYVID